MHPVQEYSGLLHRILQQAEQMIACLPTGYHYAAGQEIINFLKTHGCVGYPSGQVKDFNIGPWLTRPGKPARQHATVTIVPCFSDDVPPSTPSPGVDLITPGSCFFTDQVIVLYSVDHWSLSELALTLLHEARHARHRIGPKLAGLSPLDQPEQHESNTWLFTLNVLNVWGGKAWYDAVQQEIAWLERRSLKPAQANQIIYISSQQYWPELDQLFGVNTHLAVRKVRQALVVLTANIEYWSRRTNFPPEQVCHSLLMTHFNK